VGATAVRKLVVRCATINTHRGQGPKLPYLLSRASPEEAERIEVLNETKAYTYYIAEWLSRNRARFDLVALQEVFNGVLGFGSRLLGKFRQRDHYRVISGFRSATSHRVGFAGFKYENLMLSQLEAIDDRTIHYRLPCRIYLLAACGFTLAPFKLGGQMVWIGNTHLHPYNPVDRARQAQCIAREIRRLGDVPILFLGDFNTVPPGCRDTGFPAGEPDVNSYRNDRTFDILFEAGLRMEAHDDREEFYTYPTGLANRTLDYILFSKHWKVRAYEVLQDFSFSDHYPVYGEFQLQG
jgi:endonuclease/exonuclease/phosphatase family metal-dependent hydrolase